jgi:pimeloyl-ACP methyl ester carboxylesterase
VNRASVALAALALSLAAACAPPFAIKRDVRGAERQATANVISTGEPSRRTRNVLYDRELVARYRKDPKGALAELHANLVAGRLPPEGVGALAELSFHQARKGPKAERQSYYLASALYAWAFLFPEDHRLRPERFDPFVRLTNEIYNRGLMLGLLRDGKIDLRSASHPLPFGTLETTLDESSLVWSGHRLHDFYPVGDIEVTGFPTYYSWPGIGAPLAAKVLPNPKDVDLLGPRIRVPVTAVLQASGLMQQLQTGTVRAALVAYPGYGESRIEVDGRKIPLAAEPTAAMGLGLAETALWKFELSVFLGGQSLITKQTRLVSTRPYRRGLIPVVLVHGTGSSAIRWAQLYNELDNDPRIHDHFQFWFFSYDSGNPIIYSAALMREALEHAVAKLDPEGRDPALRRMVVMGHSQGGLLTKMLVVESGDAFWRQITEKQFADVEMSPENRELLGRAVFVRPLPFVERVVFVATPHRGSYVAGNWLAHQFARLISLPVAVTKVVTEIATFNREARVLREARGTPTAVDSMTPGNPFVKTLASLAIASSVAAHSIIAVDGDPPYSGKDDGVVEYDSAHIDGVESEVVVRSPHSCQAHPKTMEEVQRILLKHLDARVSPAPPIETPPGPRPLQQ